MRSWNCQQNQKSDHGQGYISKKMEIRPKSKEKTIVNKIRQTGKEWKA